MTASPLAQTPNDMFNAPIAEADPEIAEILDAELSRQQNGLEMIASENFVPRAVLQAQGSVLTNKYAEGYPGRRYYGGCEQVDKIETIARERAKSLFGAEYANVQPHSGAQANAAVYQALVKPGDTVLGLALDHGGHLTHGMKINFSGYLIQCTVSSAAHNQINRVRIFFCFFICIFRCLCCADNDLIIMTAEYINNIQ